MRAGYGQAALPAGNLTQRARALDDGIAPVHHFLHLSQVLRDGRCIYDQAFFYVGGDQVGPILVVDRDALVLELGRELGGSTVIARYVEALELVVACQCGHSNAANSYEINVLHTNL